MASADQKLDLILQQLQQQQQQLQALGPIQASLESLRSTICDVKEDVRNIQFTVDNHNDRLLALEAEMLEQKYLANQQQQQLRSLTLRLINFPVVSDEAADNNAGLKARVYDHVLRPLLVAAKTAKDLSSVPQANTVIEACFRPFNATTSRPLISSAASPDSAPPHVILKVSSRQIKLALLKHRKNLPLPVPADSKRIFLVEDLTVPTHKMLVAISKDKDTAKSWTIDGNIKYTVVGKPEVRTVKSVFLPLSKVLGK